MKKLSKDVKINVTNSNFITYNNCNQKTKIMENVVGIESDLRKIFESYTDEELQIFNGDNEETLKNWNRENAIEEAIESLMEETDFDD
jgi:lipopolysaccharide export LptBFGC system permease protein LptF